MDTWESLSFVFSYAFGFNDQFVAVERLIEPAYWLTPTEVEALHGEDAVKLIVPTGLLPFTTTVNVTVPLPFTMPDCPGASVAEMCEGLLMLDRLTVVVPLELCTVRVNETAPVWACIIGLGLAVSVHAPVVGVGLGEGVGDWVG